MRQVWTSPDKSGQVPTSPDKSRPVGQDTLTGSRDLQGTLGGSWDLPEAASDQRKRYQNHQNCENRRKWTHMARFGLRIRLFESHSHFLSIANPPDPKSHWKNRQTHISRKVQKSETPGSAAMCGAPLNGEIKESGPRDSGHPT